MPSRFFKQATATRGDIGVSLGTDPVTGEVGIYFYERRNGKTYLAKPVELEFVEKEEGGPTSLPTISISHIYAEPLLEAIAQALDEAGVQTDNDAKVQGTLEATKYHLEDLRSLLKLKR